MFLLVSVILSTGGGSASVHAGIPTPPPPPRSRPPPWSRHPPGSDTPQQQTPPRSRHPPEQTPREQTPPRKADSSIRSMSGRCASYWNAFLFQSVFACTLWLHGVATLWRLLDSDTCDEYGFPTCSAFSAIVTDVDVLSRDNVVTRAK